jgi:signal transduction histidine kinase
MLDFLKNLIRTPQVGPEQKPEQGVAAQQQSEQELARFAVEMQEKNQRLVETERLKSEFFANVSHELRTPLSLILAPLESLLAGEFGPLSESQRTGAQTMHNNAVRLLQMVTGLLDLARLDAHRVEIKREPLDVAALTQSLLKEFQPILQQKDLIAELQVASEETAVLLDRYLYERILFNLVANAVKFTPAGGSIQVDLRVEKDRLRLSVTDTGIGIAASDIQNLFQKFRQLEGSSTRRFEGSGLGLALVKEFAELLDGSVRVTSAPGRGSTFVVDLAAPLCDPTIGQEQPPSLSRLVQRFSTPVLGEDPDAPVPGTKLPRVLIAEDNVEMASYIAGLLRRKCQIRAARNGEVALTMARQWRPDLVLADVMMPERDGLSLCRAIKADPATKHLPVILLTALVDRDSLLKGWEAGADEYLFKPFHPRELTTRVESMLTATRERQRTEAALREARDALEVRVRERTAELARVNEELQAENKQRRELEVELRRRVEELAENQRRKDEFLATLGHELRNPLAPIRNSLKILKLGQNQDSESEALRAMMERQVVHMTRLVDDLLDVSRVSRGEVHLHKEDLDLLPIIRGSVEIVRPLIERRGHMLKIMLPNVPLLLHGDATRLEQAIANLLNNAAKYTKPGGRIELSAKRENSHIAIHVKDNGIGIKAESQSRLFDLFFQGDTVPGQIHEGLGIGLTLVRKLVEMHDGTVTVHSEGVGTGSEFVIRLPLIEVAQPVDQGGYHTTPVEPAVPAPSRRILAVDDNRDALHSTALLLELCGHDVRQAEDGREALKIAESFKPDVVLLDIGLPGGMDGHEVARHLRRMPGVADALLIAVTGYCQAEDRRRSAAAGFNHHLIKPVDPEELQALLEGRALAAVGLN